MIGMTDPGYAFRKHEHTWIRLPKDRTGADWEYCSGHGCEEIRTVVRAVDNGQGDKDVERCVTGPGR